MTYVKTLNYGMFWPGRSPVGAKLALASPDDHLSADDPRTDDFADEPTFQHTHLSIKEELNYEYLPKTTQVHLRHNDNRDPAYSNCGNRYVQR